MPTPTVLETHEKPSARATSNKDVLQALVTLLGLTGLLLIAKAHDQPADAPEVGRAYPPCACPRCNGKGSTARHLSRSPRRDG